MICQLKMEGEAFMSLHVIIFIRTLAFCPRPEASRACEVAAGELP